MSFLKVFMLVIAGFCTQLLSAQDGIEKAWLNLEKAMIQKDSATLAVLLHEDLTYGHSNGWTETKKEMIGNLVSGKMQYRMIISETPEFKLSGDVATLKTRSEISYTVNGEEGMLKLFVVQVWKKENENWKLLVRQSTKVN